MKDGIESIDARTEYPNRLVYFPFTSVISSPWDSENVLKIEVLRVSKNARSADWELYENSVPTIAIESLKLISKAVKGLLSNAPEISIQKRKKGKYSYI